MLSLWPGTGHFCVRTLLRPPLAFPVRLIPFLQVRTPHPFRRGANVTVSGEPSSGPRPRIHTSCGVGFPGGPSLISAVCAGLALPPKPAWPPQGLAAVRGTGRTNERWMNRGCFRVRGARRVSLVWGWWWLGGRSLTRPKGINSANSSCFPFSSHYHIQQWPCLRIKIDKTVLPESEFTPNICIVVLKYYWDKANWDANF